MIDMGSMWKKAGIAAISAAVVVASGTAVFLIKTAEDSESYRQAASQKEEREAPKTEGEKAIELYRQMLLKDPELQSTSADHPKSRFALADVDKDGILEMFVHVTGDSNATTCQFFVYYRDGEAKKIQIEKGGVGIHPEKPEFYAAYAHMAITMEYYRLEEGGPVLLETLGYEHDEETVKRLGLDPEENEKDRQRVEELEAPCMSPRMVSASEANLEEFLSGEGKETGEDDGIWFDTYEREAPSSPQATLTQEQKTLMSEAMEPVFARLGPKEPDFAMETADYTDEDIFSNLAYFARQWRSGLALLPEAKEREGREYENPELAAGWIDGEEALRRMEQAYGVKVKNPLALDQFEGIYAEDGEMEVDYLDGPPREFEFGFEDCHMEGENLVVQGTYTIIRDWVMEGMGTMKAVFAPNEDSLFGYSLVSASANR